MFATPVGDKGGSDVESFVTCNGAAQGSNVISATFLPSQSVMYLAYENGHADAHVPACCNNYIQLDMTKWF